MNAGTPRTAGPVAAALAHEAHDFAPDLLTLQESPPSSLPRRALVATAVLVGTLIAWAVWARLDIVATAPGRLVPSSYTKVVQPAETGVVTEILVHDGDLVRAGDVLVRLDPRLAQSDAARLAKDAELRRLNLLRIDAELAGTPLVLPAGAAPELALQVQSQYQARRRSYEDSLAQEEAALRRARADLASGQQTLAKLREVVPIAQAAAQGQEDLAREGFVSRQAADDRRRDYIEKRQELQSQGETVNSLQAAVVLQERRLEAVRSTYRSQLQSDRLDTLDQLNRLAGDIDKMHIHAGQLDVRAPADGVVKDVASLSTGAVVQAGAQLLSVVPRGEALVAEVQLSNEDAGFVAVGQKARIKIGAYPFQKYGLLDGTVTQVAPDTTQPRDAQQLPTYRALVRLASQSLASPDGDVLALTPGMLVSAEINQGERTVMEYLLSPVQKVAAQAARER